MASSSPSSSACNIIFSHNRNLTSSLASSSSSPFQNLFLPFISHSNSLSLSSKPILPRTTKLAVAKITPPQVEVQFTTDLTPPIPDSSWSEFASKVSGEWDGFGAEFTAEGKPVELPESVVPGAYREWEVQVFDWQTQCPTLADPKDPVLSYRSIKLLPTVGCEADAATVYSSDERNVAPEGSKILAFAYQNTGSYVALWPVEGKVLELEHCLINPRDRESRVRVIQILRLEDTKLKLQKIRVFCEQWYGPFRNGDQLGGCAIRDSGFASTTPLNASDVTGAWQSKVALASYQSQNNTFQEVIKGSTQDIVRNEHDLITLPRKLWCSLKESGNDETCAEVGWLLDQGLAITSRCVFSSDGKLKEISLGSDTTE